MQLAIKEIMKTKRRENFTAKKWGVAEATRGVFMPLSACKHENRKKDSTQIY